ncbi:MAG: LysR family transcriptional regulator [Lachnospiraceae bacterium]|nr:LysR family transcriptional regulator [Lachnospiraceae bacterium]
MEQNLNYYKIFYETAKNGSISKAAESLYISQPAVSKSVTKLEQSLGHTLFIRSKKGVRLTEEGQTLFEYLKKAFDSIDTAEKTLKRIGAFGMGQIRIGVSTSLCKYILLSYLQDFIKDNPHVKISIDCHPTFETIQLLKADKIDIGLICDTPVGKPYHFTPLRSIHDTFVTTQTYLDNLTLREQDSIPESKENMTELKDILTHPNSPEEEELNAIPNMTGLLLFSERNASPSSSVSLSTKEILEKSNLMLLDQGNISRQFIDHYFDTCQLHPGQVLEINNMDLLIDFAAIGMGVACVVREFVSSYIESGQVIEIPLDHAIPERTVGFLYNERSLSTTSKKFLNFCGCCNT